jgi:hypothetical protein
MAKSPKVLFYDLETSLQLVAVFQLKNQDWIQPDSLITERYIISGAWKWQGEERVHSVSVLDFPKSFAKDHTNDKYVVETLHGILSQADVIVAHNGDQFDLKYLETRILYHGLSPLPPITSIDTYKVAKSRFLFNANRLDYLGNFLKVGRKKETTSGLWMRVLKGDKAAIKEMVTYNEQDVLLLERVFLKLRPYIANHINRELLGGSGCPRCGSLKIQSRGVHRAISRVYRKFQCQGCGGWFRSVFNEKGVKVSRRVI